MTAGSTMPLSSMDRGLMGRLGSLRWRWTMLLIFSLVSCIVSMAFSRGLISSCKHRGTQTSILKVGNQSRRKQQPHQIFTSIFFHKDKVKNKTNSRNVLWGPDTTMFLANARPSKDSCWQIHIKSPDLRHRKHIKFVISNFFKFITTGLLASSIGPHRIIKCS